MKTIITCIAIMLSCLALSAQNNITNSGNMQIHAGARVGFFGDLENNGSFIDEGEMVSFNGSAGQAISGSSGCTFRKMVVNNSDGVVMQQSVTVSDTLELTEGALDLNSGTLILSRSSADAIHRTNGYILSEKTDFGSRVKWNIGSNPGVYNFPFGSSNGSYIPVTIEVSAGNIGNVTVSTYHTAYNNLPLPSPVTTLMSSGVDNSPNVVDRFWKVSSDVPGATAKLSITATPEETGTISGLNAQRWDTAANHWDDLLAGQINTYTSSTTSNTEIGGIWALVGSGTSLPVELLEFIAIAGKDHVDLIWETASETNNDFFTVEKTTDFENFRVVAIADGAGNSNRLMNYSAIDRDPFAGISYYRLKQTDFNGKYEYSDYRAVEFKNEITDIKVYPNPTTSNNINVETASSERKESINISITDLIGNIYYTKEIITGKEAERFVLDNTPDLASGIYLVNIYGEYTNFVKKIMVK